MKTFVYIAVSLDGYIAKKDGNLDWLIEMPNPEGSDFGYNEFIRKVDSIVMGKNTFEKVLTFKEWPYSKPVFILSHSIKVIPDSLIGKAELMSGAPKDILNKLCNLNYQTVYVDGGLTIQAFLRDDLIDDLIISRIPILLGEGIPLFGYLQKELYFEHIETIVYIESIVKSHYKRKRKQTNI